MANKKKEHNQIHYKNNIMIDEGIFPVIVWMNKFKSITTEFSCEGVHIKNNKRRIGYNPYVLFRCEETKDLDGITKVICDFNEYKKRSRYDSYITLEIFPANNVVPYTRFMMDFYTNSHLEDFIKYMKKRKIG